MKLNDLQTENILNAIALAAMVQVRGEDLHGDGKGGELDSLYRSLVQPGTREDPWQDLAFGASMLSQGLLNLVTGLLSYIHDEHNENANELLARIAVNVMGGGKL